MKEWDGAEEYYKKVDSFMKKAHEQYDAPKTNQFTADIKEDGDYTFPCSICDHRTDPHSECKECKARDTSSIQEVNAMVSKYILDI